MAHSTNTRGNQETIFGPTFGPPSVIEEFIRRGYWFNTELIQRETGGFIVRAVINFSDGALLSAHSDTEGSPSVAEDAAYVRLMSKATFLLENR